MHKTKKVSLCRDNIALVIKEHRKGKLIQLSLALKEKGIKVVIESKETRLGLELIL